jgi:hypothetical protein
MKYELMYSNQQFAQLARLLEDTHTTRYITLWTRQLSDRYWEDIESQKRSRVESIFAEGILHHWLGSWDLGITDQFPEIIGVNKSAWHIVLNPVWPTVNWLGANTQSPLAQVIRDPECIAETANRSPEEMSKLKQDYYFENQDHTLERKAEYLAEIRADPIRSAVLSEKKANRLARLEEEKPGSEKKRKADRYEEKAAEDGGETALATKNEYDTNDVLRRYKIAQSCAYQKTKRAEKKKRDQDRAKGLDVPDCMSDKGQPVLTSSSSQTKKQEKTSPFFPQKTSQADSRANW